MAATVMVALEILTKLLYYTPVSILASIILSALPGLINVQEVRTLWKVDKMDFLTCMGSFLGVLFGSVEIGLSVAVTITHSISPLLFHFSIHQKYVELAFPARFCNVVLIHGVTCCSLVFPLQRLLYSQSGLK